MPILYRGKLKIQSCSLFANLLNPCSSFQSLFIARSIQYAGLLLSGTLGNPHPDDIFTCLTAKQALIFRTFRDEPFYPLISFKTKDASTTIGQRLSSNVFDLEVAFLLPLSLARVFKKSGTVYSCTLSETSSAKVSAVLTHQEPTRSNVFISGNLTFTVHDSANIPYFLRILRRLPKPYSGKSHIINPLRNPYDRTADNRHHFHQLLQKQIPNRGFLQTYLSTSQN